MVDTNKARPDKPRRTSAKREPAHEEPAQVTRSNAYESSQEVLRLGNILRERLVIIGSIAYVKAPINKDLVRELPLFPGKGQDDTARTWVLMEYMRTYPDETKPQIGSYNLARSYLKIERNLPEPAPAPRSGRDQAPREKEQSEKDALEEEVRARSDCEVSARDAGVRYYRVPYSKTGGDVTGIWKLGDKRPVRLLGAHVTFLSIRRPHASSKSQEYVATFRAVNAQGLSKTFETDREGLEKGGLDAKFVGYAPFPQTRSQREQLLEALNCLMMLDEVSIKDQYEALGWAEDPERGLVWIANNGLETVNGFLPGEQASIVSPEIISPGNGYRALPNPPEPGDAIWKLFLTELNPNNVERIYGKLGAVAYVMLPDGAVENAGTLNFAIETVGEGSGVGKSAEDNFILSLFGGDFDYNRAAYLSDTDTQGGRLRPMAKVKHNLFSDYDRKARPGNNKLEKEHESRKQVITQYADHTGGGVISSRDAQKERARGKPAGGALLTGNYDHVLLSIEREEEATEYRVCTFLVPLGEKAERKVSEQISTRRDELYTWGRAFRRWIMRKYNEDKSAFMLLVQGLRPIAESAVAREPYQWPHDRYLNQALELVWGALVWEAFLHEEYPECELAIWFETMREPFVENRYERAWYVQNLVDNRKGDKSIEEFTLEILRYALGTSQAYITSQQDKPLASDEYPRSLTDAGYKHDIDVRDGGDIWRTGQTKIGHYLARQECIAFKPDMLYSLLSIAAQKQKYPFPGKQDFKRLLAESGLSLVKRDESGEPREHDVVARINGKSTRFVVIPLQALYPEPDVEELDEEQELLAEIDQARKVIPFKTSTGDTQSAPVSVPLQSSDEIVDESL